MTIPAQSTGKSLALTLLGKTLGFRDCRPETLAALVEGGRLQTFGKGEAIVRRGEAFETLFLIVRGSVETSINPREGHRHLISFLQPGDVAGIIGILDGLGHVNDMYARERGTELLLMPGALVREQRARDPRLVHAFELQLAFRSRLLYERLDTHPGVELEVRLARMVLVFSRLYGVPCEDGTVLALKMSQADLGDLLGVPRQRINTALKILKDQGFIQIKYSTLTVTDMDGMQAFSNY